MLELLTRQSEGLTKSQLARELNRTVSEIFRMLVCLERRGYIAALDEERYSLTLRLFQLVQQHPPTERLIVDSLPIMSRVAHETRQSCQLGVLERNKVVFVAQQNAPTDTGFYGKLGSHADINGCGQRLRHPCSPTPRSSGSPRGVMVAIYWEESTQRSACSFAPHTEGWV